MLQIRDRTRFLPPSLPPFPLPHESSVNGLSRHAFFRRRLRAPRFCYDAKDTGTPENGPLDATEVATYEGNTNMVSVRRLSLLMLFLATLATAQAKTATGPNFVIIFIDDMGYGDIGPFGSTINDTPNLDRMATEGRRLTSFYVAAPVCTPSRAALMTGCYPLRVGLHRGSRHIVLFPSDAHGLAAEEITVAEVLKEAGYATGCFGKWHLGDQPPFLPTAQGFDAYYGIPYSNDMWAFHPRAGKPGIWQMPHLPIVQNETVVDTVEDMRDQAQLCRRFTEQAVEFIKQHHDERFFVYLPHAFVHHPRAATDAFRARAETVTEAQIEEVDWSVGQILSTLRELDLQDETLVLFTSDNGGARGCVNAPLRGGKGSCHEGGMRVPTIAWWPGTVPAASRHSGIATSLDLLPTFADLAGATLPDDRTIDGMDLTRVLTGPEAVPSPRETFFYYHREDLRAVRHNEWKLLATGELYHLPDDIGETQDVAAEHPDVVQTLATFLEQARQDLGDGSRDGADIRKVGFVQNPRPLIPIPDYTQLKRSGQTSTQ